MALNISIQFNGLLDLFIYLIANCSVTATIERQYLFDILVVIRLALHILGASCILVFNSNCDYYLLFTKST